MSDLDAKLYAALEGCKAQCLPISFCASDTAKWELLAILRRQLTNNDKTESEGCNEQS